MNNYSKIFSAGLLLFCAACTESAEVSSKAVDVTFSSRSASGVVGYNPTYVRSYLKENNKRVESRGVNCAFSGGGFSGKVITPGLVNLPDYGEKSKAITFKCSDSSSEKTVQAVPYNKTSSEKLAMGAGGGLLGVLIMAGVDAGRDKTDDDWSYHPVEVVFEKK